MCTSRREAAFYKIAQCGLSDAPDSRYAFRPSLDERDTLQQEIESKLFLHPQQVPMPQIGYPSAVPKVHAIGKASYPSGQSPGYPEQLYRSVAVETSTNETAQQKCVNGNSRGCVPGRFVPDEHLLFSLYPGGSYLTSIFGLNLIRKHNRAHSAQAIGGSCGRHSIFGE